MRGLSLLGLLIVMTIILIAYSQHVSQIASTNAKIRPQVEQMAGVDQSGRRVSDSYTLHALSDGGHLRGMRVETLSPDSPMRSYFGLKPGDIIVELGQRGGVMTKARDMDPELMTAYIAEAYQFEQPLIVERDGKTVTLKPGAAGNKSESTLDLITKQK